MSPTMRTDRTTAVHNLNKFVAAWRKRLDGWEASGETAIEKKYAQQLWTDLLGCFGVNATRMDLFEQDGKRSSTGSHGWIDMFWPGVVVGEAKSPGVKLDIAYDQARDYIAGSAVSDFELPRYILCSDFETFRLVRLGDADTRYDITFALDDAVQHVDQLRFLAGYEDITPEEQEAASIVASKLMADLFTAMVGGDVDEAVGDEAPTNPEDEDAEVQATSIFLTRLLFLLFGDDSSLWDQDLFYRFVLNHTTPENLGSQLDALFDVLNTPEQRRRRVPHAMAQFPYVNGSIFNRNGETRTTTFFSSDMREALLNACRFHWANISPALFGAMFQLVKSKEARREDGEHYTSEKNILKTIGPLFLDDLRAQADALIAAPSTRVAKLRQFRDSLSDILCIDSAVGSGNFIIVAYRELRRIETDIIAEIRKRDHETNLSIDASLEQKLSINQFHGFELNWWPAKIAETAMFLVDHQANQELAHRLGFAPDRLPISITAHIHHCNALHVDWKELIPKTAGKTYIFGNPPFIGQYTKTDEQTEDMKLVWGKDYNGYLDYVTGWHAKAKDFFTDRDGEFAYVTTNSISQGMAVPALFGPMFRDRWRIKFAHRTFAWDSEAPGKAAVHCVIVGFTRSPEVKPKLWDYPDVKGEPVAMPVERQINAYLVDGVNILVNAASRPISSEVPPVKRGRQPTEGGNLIVERKDVDEVRADKVASKYLRPFRGSKELVRNEQRWCLFLDQVDPDDLRKSALLRERVENCRQWRSSQKETGDAFKLKDIPHMFRPGPAPMTSFICVPSVVSETRRYFTAGHLPEGTVPSNLVFWANDPDGFLFGLISSSMFITWQKTVGGRLESRLRFANKVTWNTFPVPPLTDKQRAAIAAAGKKVLEARDLHPDRSLAEHYNPLSMDPALLKAHNALDREVDKAFGAARKLTTVRQRQEILFAQYAKLTS